MDFRILGPLEVSDAGRPIRVARRKQRALLAAMLLRAGRVVSVDRLLDDLWGESPPPSARASLQNAVSMLRKILGPDVLVTRPPGYALAVTEDQVDLLRFERLVEQARELPPPERAALLREALALWRGAALADVAFEPFAEIEADRLEEAKTAAREELVEAQLALGQHEAVISELEAIIAEQPFRERPRAQLMVALYRSGRQAEALEAYQHARRFLDEELGLEPSPMLQKLQQSILRHDSALEAPVREPPEETPGMERRATVTVLFADVVDSTALAAQLDPEVYWAVLERYFKSARATLERHGGVAAKALGEAVVGVFGIPRRHEDDALRAVRAAVELGESAARLNREVQRSHGVTVRLRIGVNTGEAIVGDGHSAGATGYSVHIAAKLAQSAAPDEVLIGASTYRLVRETVTGTPLPAISAGAKAAPIPAFRVTSVEESESAIPRHLEAPLVGRGLELEVLHRAFDEARELGGCRVVTVLGDAGIGKTRLARELAGALHGEAELLVGRCVSYGEGATYVPIADIVRQLAPGATAEEIATLFGDDADGPLVARRLRELTGIAEGAAPAQEAFWAVRRLLEAAARNQPVLLLLEDVHWAEPTLLDLITNLAAHEIGGPMLVVCLARPDLLEVRPEWAVDMILSPLNETEIRALVANLPAGAELGDSTRARIVEQAAGNALFAEQLLAHAAEAGEEALSVPASLEALLASRLDRLPAAERHLLGCAAVVGREFTREVVEQLSGLDASTALSGLFARGFMQEAAEGALAFHHALIREVAYAGVTKQRRAELHERAAEWLDDHGEVDEIVGYHLEQAHRYRTEIGVVDRHTRRLAAEAGERLSSAGVRAWRVGDAPAATNLLRRAAELLPDGHPSRPETLRELGGALWALGEAEPAGSVLTDAIESSKAAGNHGMKLRAQVDLAYLRLFTDPEGRSAELLDLAAEAIPVLEALGDDQSLGRTWLAVAFVHGGMHGRYRASEEAAERALDHYRRLGWVPAMCVRELAAAVHYGPAAVGGAISRCRALLKEADRGSTAILLTYLGGLEAMRSRFAPARRLVADARTSYEELGRQTSLHIVWAPVAAEVEFLAGAADAAEGVLRESCAVLEREGEKVPLSAQRAQLTRILYAKGGYDEAERWAAESRLQTASDDKLPQLAWLGVRSKLLARQGALAEGEALASQAVRLAETTDALNHHADVLLDLAEVLRFGGREGEASSHVREAISLYQQKGNRAALSRAQRLSRELAPA